MGEHDTRAGSERDLRTFMRAVLRDVQALEHMIEAGMFETGKRRIGAEQEMFLVDRAMRPVAAAEAVLHAVADDRFTTELALFNLECNAAPRLFGGSCLGDLEAELHQLIAKAREAAATCGAEILLTGILPTLHKSDLGLDNMTPRPRYEILNRTLTEQRGGSFHILIKGIDELQTTHDNVMLESCNTSFQIHFQVAPQEFARLYNVAQAITAPVLAAATNSPLFLGHRLWQETRVALFQLSVDERSSAHQARGFPQRVSFGTGWVRDSVLEIFREQISRFRMLLATEIDEDSLAQVRAGVVPELRALRLHNGTTYRWNRACYGVSGGVAHLRIENRVLPAGPTVVDEVANAAFFFGLMSGFLEEHGDVTRKMPFDHAKHNFYAAARYGLKAQLTWLDDRTLTAAALIRKHLLPMARAGLERSGVDRGDIDRYLGIIDERVRAEATGSQWVLGSLASMGDGATRELRESSLTTAMLENQKTGAPVHTWEVCRLREDDELRRQAYRRVGQFMSTDLFTVHPDDLVDLAASVMDWEHIRHVPVEDNEGRLVGIVTHRMLLRVMARGGTRGDDSLAVRDIMHASPMTVSPDTRTLDAMRLMREHHIGCLPVIEDGKLVGIITESDLIEVSSRLLERYLSEA